MWMVILIEIQLSCTRTYAPANFGFRPACPSCTIIRESARISKSLGRFSRSLFIQFLYISIFFPITLSSFLQFFRRWTHSCDSSSIFYFAVTSLLFFFITLCMPVRFVNKMCWGNRAESVEHRIFRDPNNICFVILHQLVDCTRWNEWNFRKCWKLLISCLYRHYKATFS